MYILLETTFGTVQKWSLRPLLDSSKSGRNIVILLYNVVLSLDKSLMSEDHLKEHYWELLFHGRFIDFINFGTVL